MNKLDFVLPECTSENLNFVRDAVSRLSKGERQVLILEMLRDDSTQVTLGGSNSINDDLVSQIQSGQVDLSEILKAVARKVSKEKPDN